jgi:hypothetical protein
MGKEMKSREGSRSRGRARGKEAESSRRKWNESFARAKEWRRRAEKDSN